MRPLRIGVVGVGYLGKYHAEKYAQMKDVKLVGVVDVIAERAEEVASRFGGQAFTDYREMLGKVDAVSIVVPTPLHFPVSRFFLENNVDVLIEKPVTETVAQADTLIEISESNKLIMQVGHLERFNPAVIALGKVVDYPLFIESHRLSYYNPRGTEVDVVLDLMIHDIDIILSLVKSDIEYIHAVGVPVVTTKVDIANVRLVFENGCVANITASRISMKNVRKIRIFQKNTYVAVDYANRNITVIRKDGKGTDLPVPGMSMDRSSFETADSLKNELTAFVESVRHREPPLVSGRDGRKALRVARDILDQIEAAGERVLGSLLSKATGSAGEN